jgi:hypothetical protein
MAAKKSTRYLGIAVGLSVIGVAALTLSVFAYWRELHHLGISLRSDEWGSFGAYVGGIAGTIIALATLIALAVTLALQAREMEKARHAVARQIFDSTFFQLLHRFNDVLDSVSVKQLRMDDGEYEIVEGRTAISLIYKQMSNRYPVNRDADVRGAIVDMHRDAYATYENMLGPYFRTLYHVFKFIDGQDSLDDQEKLDYANIARAQLSRFEIALLFYNCLTPFGDKFKPLIEKYGILKHVNKADLADARHKDDRTLYEATAFMSQAQRDAAQSRTTA